MDRFIFVLGSNWQLSIAELDNYLKYSHNKGKIIDYSANIAVVEFEELHKEKYYINKLMEIQFTLGGCQKIAKIFDFIDKKSTLYSTFQANNLPSVKSQFNLFLLYMKYYFGSGSLEAFEVGDLLFSPKKFKSKLNQRNKKFKNVINSSAIKDIEVFPDYFSIISNFDNFDLLFEKVLKNS